MPPSHAPGYAGGRPQEGHHPMGPPNGTTPSATSVRSPAHDPYARVGLRRDLKARRKARTRFLNHHIDRAGYTFTSLAARMGVDVTYISRIVGGTRTPSLDTTWRMAEALGLSLDLLARVLVGTGPVDWDVPEAMDRGLGHIERGSTNG